jgi:aryl-alcohol dehydrogenase-like predicted oxidoreductase
MQFLNHDIAPLGLGCWPVGGAMYAEDGTSLGYSNVDDKASVAALQAAAANGIRVFDTAAAYGAGHSERLLAKALKPYPDAVIVTKIGIPINEQTKQLSFEGFGPDDVIPAIEQCAKRLRREAIDLVLLHLNELPVPEAEQLFDQMDNAVARGLLKAYGWSSDFADSIRAVAGREHFVAVEHAMNVLIDAPGMQGVAESHGLHALIRSPLAMGFLSGRYNAQTQPLGADDVRGTDQGWLQFFSDGRPNPLFLERFDAIKELLSVGGRSAVQGALGWLWARHPGCVPIPGARTVEQVEGLVGALSFGPLPATVMAEIEALIDRTAEVDREDRAR